MKRTLPAVAILLLVVAPGLSHRLDEYLQGVIISVEKSRVDAQITLTPGVAVFPAVIADIDGNGDGVISEIERRAYAGQILRDLSISIDGHLLTPHLVSMEFPAIEEMKEGRGEIRIEFDAALPRGGPKRSLILENRHQSRIAAYQVNCLVPSDPDIRIVRQNRNYSQSFYELDFELASRASNSPVVAWTQGAGRLLGTVALLLFAWLALLWGQRVKPWKRAGGRWQS